MQRRMFVRIVGDLAHRFPMAEPAALESEHPSELANRYFDIMTIQKATASMLLDGISIVLQATIGLILLAFYHPFLLGFDIILLLLMTVVTYILGRGGIKSAIAESKVKYELAHWLQDVISFPTAFRLHGGSGYAIERANRLTVRLPRRSTGPFPCAGPSVGLCVDTAGPWPLPRCWEWVDG